MSTAPLETVQRRRTQIAKIENPKYRYQSLCKRGDGLIKKAMELSFLTGALVALVIISTSGNLRAFGASSVEEVFLGYLCQKDKVKLPMHPRQRWDCVEKESDSCKTKEECASLILKYQVVLAFLSKKWMGLENDPSLKAGAGHERVVGAGRCPEVPNDYNFSLPFSLSLKKKRTMHIYTSPSVTLRKQRNANAPAPAPAVSLSESKKHPPTAPPSEAQRRRTNIEYIKGPKERSQSLCKRRNGLVKKAQDLHILTGARVALIIIPTSGKLCSVGKPSVEEVFSEYLHHEGNGKLPICPKEWLDCAEKECHSCTTKEDCASLIKMCKVVISSLRKKWMDLENKPSVNAGAGRDPEGSTDNRLHAELDDLKASDPIFYESIIGSIMFDHGDSATGGESSGVDSNSTCSDPEGRELDIDGFLTSPKDYPNLSEDNG